MFAGLARQHLRLTESPGADAGLELVAVPKVPASVWGNSRLPENRPPHGWTLGGGIADPHFVPVAQFTAEASAGHGSLVQDETHDTTCAYSRAFLTRHGSKPDNPVAISVKGDSMPPDLHDGDIILVDCSNVDPAEIRNG